MTKKKLVIAGIALFAVAIVAIASITAVFAAISTTNNAGFVIHYEAANVSATVEVKYAIYTTADQSINTFTSLIGATSLDGEGEIKPEENVQINLQASNQQVLVQFIVSNLDADDVDHVGRPFKLSFERTSTTNAQMAVIVKNVTTTGTNVTPVNLTSADGNKITEYEVAKNSTVYVYVMYCSNNSSTISFDMAEKFSIVLDGDYASTT